MDKNIVLIGPMGSGKTSVGQRLACTLNRDFFDTDFEIVTKTGVSIEHIFDVEGEKGFRERETKALSDVINIPNIVIATGGGIVTRAENLALLYKTFVVYLTADIDLLAERCSESQARPLLNQAVDQYKAISDIFYQREEAYKQAADCTIHMDGKKLYAIINEIKSYL